MNPPHIDEIVRVYAEQANAGVEAMLRALIAEKGPESAIDYELVQQLHHDGTMRWRFQKIK